MPPLQLVEIIDIISNIVIDDQFVLVVHAHLHVVLRYQDGIPHLGSMVLP